MSGKVTSDAEARAMVRQLTLEGFCCISVTETGASKIMSGSILKRWLALTEE